MSAQHPAAWYPKVVRSPRGVMRQNKTAHGRSLAVRELLAQVKPKAQQ